MENPKSIAAIRKDYSSASLSKADASKNPLKQFNKWFDEALQGEVDEVNAMTLSTASKEGKPAARIVLLKGVEKDGFVFFTNYSSKKGQQLAKNPYASLTFFWKELERQVRIDGKVKKISEQESQAYFKTRPYKSKVGAWASEQSKPLASRVKLMQKFTLQAAKFIGRDVPKPDFWGGYLLTPTRMEFWQGRPSRLHDRINYTFDENQWKIERLSP